MRLVWGTITAVLEPGEDAAVLDVRLDSGDVRRALAYPTLCGTCVAGDRVLLNTTAVDLRLGTGGSDLVVARVPEGGAPSGVSFDDPSDGHIMKLRYSPLQRDVLSVEEPASPHHEVMVAADTLDGMPVVCCGLHSQVPVVAAAVKDARPDARIAYVMTDEATLALGMSRAVRACRGAGLLDATVTAGQSFGGEWEAVNVYSGLLAARSVVGAHVAIVAIGPGVAGTGTPFGHGGLAQGTSVNAVSALGGSPVAALRLSFADERERHSPVSHHTVTALRHVALARCDVALPVLPSEQAEEVERALAEAGIWERHRRLETTRHVGALPDLRGVRVSTMGRGPEDDPAFFAAAAAAGDAAAGML